MHYRAIVVREELCNKLYCPVVSLATRCGLYESVFCHFVVELLIWVVLRVLNIMYCCVGW